MTPVSRQTIRAIQASATEMSEKYSQLVSRVANDWEVDTVTLATDVRDLAQLVAGLAGMVERLSEEP